jgi:hypothetical protein
MRVRQQKPSSSPYVVYADWFEQERHLLPNLTDGSHAERMNKDMESPSWEAPSPTRIVLDAIRISCNG